VRRWKCLIAIRPPSSRIRPLAGEQLEGVATAAGSVGSFAGCDCAGRREVKLEAIKRPKEVSLGEHTSLGPKATAPITVICLSPDLTLGVSSRTYSGMDTRDGAIKFLLRLGRAFVKTRRPGSERSPALPGASYLSGSSPATWRQICDPMISRHDSVPGATLCVKAKVCV
jgi:hypothetical protein